MINRYFNMEEKTNKKDLKINQDNEKKKSKGKKSKVKSIDKEAMLHENVCTNDEENTISSSTTHTTITSTSASINTSTVTSSTHTVTTTHTISSADVTTTNVTTDHISSSSTLQHDIGEDESPKNNPETKSIKINTKNNNNIKEAKKTSKQDIEKKFPKKEKPKPKKRQVKDNEITSKTQTTLTDHFQVRRSERRVKSISKKDDIELLKQTILSQKEDGLEVRTVDDKGRGVFSTRYFNKGDLVCEYAGDLIDLQEARSREIQYESKPELGCYMYFFQYQNKKYCVDATKESGRLGRLLNHSKTKHNVTTKLFPINSTPHLILTAARDIQPDEELLYDYGDRSKAATESHPWLKL